MQEEEILEELRKEKYEGKSLKGVLSKKHVTKWEMDEAFLGEA